LEEERGEEMSVAGMGGRNAGGRTESEGMMERSEDYRGRIGNQNFLIL
jgi:hypothetical protein